MPASGHSGYWNTGGPAYDRIQAEHGDLSNVELSNEGAIEEHTFGPSPELVSTVAFLPKDKQSDARTVDTVADASSERDADRSSTYTPRSQGEKGSWYSIRRLTSAKDATHEWEPTWKRTGPLAGIFCLFLALGALMASFAILYSSNNVPTSQWKYQPSAYLAVTTAVANQAMRYASIQGIAIAWWSKSIRGTTIDKLHHNWNNGLMLWRALSAGRHMSILSLACIFSTLVAIDGPLLQRASSVASVPILDDYIPLNISLAPELPTGYIGNWFIQKDAYSLFPEKIPTSNGTAKNDIVPEDTPNSYPIMEGFYKNTSMSGFISGCPGVCRATVRAPALARTQCRSHTIHGNFNHSYAMPSAPILWNQTAFLTDAFLLVDEKESINVLTAYSISPHCVGNLNVTTCTLESAIGAYDVVITNNVITSAVDMFPEIVAIANNTAVVKDPSIEGNTQAHNSTLAGIVDWTMTLYESAVQYVVDADGVPSVSTDGSFWEQYLIEKDQDLCVAFLDPTDDILRSMNAMMFRAGIHIAQTFNITSLSGPMDPGLSIHQNITALNEGVQNVFQTNFVYFIAAAVVEFLCIIVIAPTYYGWWKLGRAVSFSPLEVAKAFQAPLLADCNSNASAAEIARILKGRPVQYGATSTAMEGTDDSMVKARKITFGDPSSVSRPKEKLRFAE